MVKTGILVRRADWAKVWSGENKQPGIGETRGIDYQKIIVTGAEFGRTLNARL